LEQRDRIKGGEMMSDNIKETFICNECKGSYEVAVISFTMRGIWYAAEAWEKRHRGSDECIKMRAANKQVSEAK